MVVLVEGWSTDAVAVAALLAAEGASVRIVGPGEAPPAAAALQGVDVVEGVDLDDCQESVLRGVSAAYLDVWTPEVAPRVGCLRRRGTRITSIGDLVLERSAVPVVGVTGTAGKTTTTALLAHLLRTAGIPVVASAASPSGNMWPGADLLARLPGAGPGALVVVELTSSHLAFMSRSPAIAVVTTFWPDHVELHGSLAAYRAAKERIVRRQGADDVVVADLTSPAVAWFAGRTHARPVWFADRPTGEAIAWIEGDEVVLRDGDGVVRAALPGQLAFRGPRAVGVAAACAAALAAGAAAARLAAALATAPAPPHRAGVVGRVQGVEIVDDGMAATPVKARALFAGLEDASIVLLCGGQHLPAWGAVHATAAEQEALALACDEIARVACATVVFGPAGERLLPLLADRGVRAVGVATLDEGVVAALERLAGARALVFAPMFPVPAADRARFPGLALAFSAEA